MVLKELGLFNQLLKQVLITIKVMLIKFQTQPVMVSLIQLKLLMVSMK